jgi:hypothetical protein
MALVRSATAYPMRIRMHGYKISRLARGNQHLSKLERGDPSPRESLEPTLDGLSRSVDYNNLTRSVVYYSTRQMFHQQTRALLLLMKHLTIH